MKKKSKKQDGAIAGMLMTHRAADRLGRPSLHVDARMDYIFPGSDKKYERQELKRLKGEIAAIQKEIKHWDSAKVANRALHSLKVDLASKRARLEETRARLGVGSSETQPAEVAESVET